MAELILNIGFNVSAADAIGSLGKVGSELQEVGDSAVEATSEVGSIGGIAANSILYLKDTVREALGDLAYYGKSVVIGLGAAGTAVGLLSAAFPPLIALEAPIGVLAAGIGLVTTVAWGAGAALDVLGFAAEKTTGSSKQLRQEQAALGGEVATTTKKWENYRVSVDTAATSQKNINTELLKTKDLMKDSTSSVEKLAEKWTDFVQNNKLEIKSNWTQNIATLRGEIASLFNMFSKGGSDDSMFVSFKTTDSWLRSLGLAIGAITSETDKYAERTQALTQAQTELITKFAEQNKTLSDLNKAYREQFGISDIPKNVAGEFLKLRQNMQSVFTEATKGLVGMKGDLASLDNYFQSIIGKKTPDTWAVQFANMTREINGSITPLLGNMIRLNSVAEEVKQSGAETSEEILNIANAQRAALQEQRKEIEAISKRTGVSVDELYQALATKSANAISKYEQKIENEITQMIEAAKIVAEASNDEFEAAITGFMTYASNMSIRMKEAMTGLSNELKLQMENLSKAMKGFNLGGDLSTTQSFSKVKESIAELLETSNKTFQDMRDNATKRITEMTAAYSDMLEQDAEDDKKHEKQLQEVSKKITDFAKKAGDDLAKVGAAVEKELRAALDNISSKMDAIRDKIKEISKQQEEEAKKSQDKITDIHDRAYSARVAIAQKGMNAEQLMADKIAQIAENNARAAEFRAKGDETSLAKATKLYEENISLAQSFSEVKLSGYERMDAAGKRQIDSEIAQLKNTQNLTEAQKIRLAALEEFKTKQETIVTGEAARATAITAVNQAEKNLSETETQASDFRQKAYEKQKDQLQGNLEALQKLSDQIKGGLAITFDKEGAKSDFEQLMEDLPTAKVKIDADDAITKFRTELEEVEAIKLKFDLTHLNAELQNEIAGIKVNADLTEFANNISSSVKDAQKEMTEGIKATFYAFLDSTAKTLDLMPEKIEKTVNSITEKQMGGVNAVLQRVQDLLAKPIAVNVNVKEGQGFAKTESWG